MTYPKKLCINLTPSISGEGMRLFLTADKNGYIIEELSLQSYGSSACFNTMGIFTSEKLFKLARKVLQFELSLCQGEQTE